jgi:hypothetical protein
MKRAIVALAAAGMMALAATGAARADQPTGLEPNPNTNSIASDNCLAYYSAIWQHNGLIVRDQDRQAEVKSLQEACNDANDNGNGG